MDIKENIDTRQIRFEEAIDTVQNRAKCRRLVAA